MAKFFIIENQIRDDGEVNTTTTSRSTFALAVSYYHERYSKMVVNTQFPQVALMLTDEKLSVIDHAVIDTLYQPAEVTE